MYIEQARTVVEAADGSLPLLVPGSTIQALKGVSTHLQIVLQHVQHHLELAKNKDLALLRAQVAEQLVKHDHLAAAAHEEVTGADVVAVELLEHGDVLLQALAQKLGSGCAFSRGSQ